MTRLPIGSIHGRFQPFHLGHLEYALAASERCSFLYVGLTQPEIRHLRSGETQPQHRYREADNPMAFWERAAVVDAALRESGLRPDRFRIVPFPIETAELLAEYVPLTAVAFTTVYEDWNREKIHLLRAQGFSVEVLWERDVKTFSGGEVRRRLRAGDDSWRDLVPPAAAAAIDELGVPDRMRSRSSGE